LHDIKRLCDIVEALPDYEFRDTRLGAIAEELPEHADMDNLARLITEAGKTCGFTNASIFLLCYGSAITFEKRVCTSFPPEWLRAYDVNRYQYVDPVVARAISGGDPFLFSDLSRSSSLIEAFWTDSVAHGIGENGCCFVYDLDMNIRIGLSFASMGPPATVAEAFRVHRSDLDVLGRIACDTFIEHSGVFQTERADLSVEELRFLKSLISQSASDDVAALLQDQEMQPLQTSICEHLGVATIFQALAVASRERWFNDLPFDGPEVAKPYPGVLQREPSDRPTRTDPALAGRAEDASSMPTEDVRSVLTEDAW
jgi:hypothetical protein